jgi:hypothetical protein
MWYSHHADIFASGQDKFFIAREKGKSYEFAAYDTAEEFADVVLAQHNCNKSSKRKPKEISYHELIPEWRPRRIHFDVDYKGTLKYKNEFIEDVLKACEEELTKKSLSFSPNEVVILDSSSAQKTSLHIILTNVITLTPKECAKFCKNVIDIMHYRVPESRIDYVNYIDKGVYEKNRCFRLPYCTKKGQNRYLVPYSFTYKGVSYNRIDDATEAKKSVFLDSVIGVKDNDNHTVVGYDITEKVYVSRSFSKEEADLIVSITKDKLTTSEWQFTAELSSKGDAIDLKRIASGPCRICAIKHDRENSRLTVTEGGRIMMNCWRSSNRPQYIASVSLTEGIKEIEENVDGRIGSRYLLIDESYDTTRTSSDLIATLIAKYGYIE